MVGYGLETIAVVVPTAIAALVGYGLRSWQAAIAPQPPAPAPPDSIPEPIPAKDLICHQLAIQARFKGDFLARTAHELRAPLNSVIGLHQLILEDLCETPAEEREFVAQAKDAALKLLKLLDTLIAASKLDSGRESPQIEPLSVAELFQVVHRLTAMQAANHNLRFEVDPPEATVTVAADGRWLRTLLVGLIEDTISHAPSGTLRLWYEVSAEQVALCLGSDRPIAPLRLAFDTPIDTPAWADADVSQADNIRLSTGLVLATARLMLPVMQGKLEIVSPAVPQTRPEATSKATSKATVETVIRLWLPRENFV